MNATTHAGGDRALTPPESRLLERLLRRERLFPGFLALDLGVAAALSGYWAWTGSWSGARAVVVLLLLLSARAHLRPLRSVRLLRKLSRGET